MSRLLALKVACLTAVDREWLLCSLTAQQRDLIQPLLAQIETLGLHRDPSILRQLIEVQSDVDESDAVINEQVVKSLSPFWLAFLRQDIKKLASEDQLNALNAFEVSHVPVELSACLDEYVVAKSRSAGERVSCHK